MAKAYGLRNPITTAAREQLSAYPEILQDFLYARGIETAEKAEEFLNPSWEKHTHDPFLIAGMEKAVERILFGMKRNERITIWSDYDCDGTPGGSILHDYFKKIGYQNFTNYIPHRYLEGYGLNISGIEKLHVEGTTLIITVDSGIADVEPVRHAQGLGIDVIVTDHHLTQEELPPAFIVINSKQNHCEYPFDMLCGAAVAWKLGQALLKRGKFENIPEGWEKWLLDLAGLSTIADMVPLNGENRVFAHYGLKVLRQTRRPGLLKLFRKMRIDPRNVTEDDVGFMIAPRINAASRMGDPRLAFELLTSTDEDGRAGALADELEKLNSARRGVVGSMVKEMKHTLSERKPVPSVIVMGNPSWRPGLLGLAANNIMEEHSKPVFLWGREGGNTLKGSCRSDGSVDVVRLMQTVPSGVLTEFGGHALSGGFAVHPDHVHYLENHLVEAYGKTKQDIAEENIVVDKKIGPDEVDWLLWDIISQLAPFGIENPKPLFLLERQEVKNVKQFGKAKEHLEIIFAKSNGDSLRAIQFFNAPGAKKIKQGEKISILAHVEKSFFGYKPELRLRIVDFV